jgi:uncharacterized membrane protein YesL
MLGILLFCIIPVGTMKHINMQRSFYERWKIYFGAGQIPFMISMIGAWIILTAMNRLFMSANQLFVSLLSGVVFFALIALVLAAISFSANIKDSNMVLVIGGLWLLMPVLMMLVSASEAKLQIALGTFIVFCIPSSIYCLIRWLKLRKEEREPDVDELLESINADNEHS